MLTMKRQSYSRLQLKEITIFHRYLLTISDCLWWVKQDRKSVPLRFTTSMIKHWLLKLMNRLKWIIWHLACLMLLLTGSLCWSGGKSRMEVEQLIHIGCKSVRCQILQPWLMRQSSHLSYTFIYFGSRYIISVLRS